MSEQQDATQPSTRMDETKTSSRFNRFTSVVEGRQPLLEEEILPQGSYVLQPISTPAVHVEPLEQQQNPSSPALPKKTDPGVMIIRTQAFHGEPMIVTCMSCHETSLTLIKRSSGFRTHEMALKLIAVCCCLLPYYRNACRDTSHFCSHCGSYQGTSKF